MAISIDDRIEKALIKATLRSTHKRHQTGCVIVGKNGATLASGCSHSSSFRLKEVHSIHAEIHARWNARHFDLNMHGATAFIMTIARKSGNITLAAPCLTCAITLRTAGIETVCFTVREGHWRQMNLDEDLSNLKVYPRRDNASS